MLVYSDDKFHWCFLLALLLLNKLLPPTLAAGLVAGFDALLFATFEDLTAAFEFELTPELLESLLLLPSSSDALLYSVSESDSCFTDAAAAASLAACAD